MDIITVMKGILWCSEIKTVLANVKISSITLEKNSLLLKYTGRGFLALNVLIVSWHVMVCSWGYIYSKARSLKRNNWNHHMSNYICQWGTWRLFGAIHCCLLLDY